MERNKPYYWTDRKTWYVLHEGKRVKLAKAPDVDDEDGRKAAIDAWHKLKAGSPQIVIAGQSVTVLEVIRLYLIWYANNHRGGKEGSSYALAHRFCLLFANYIAKKYGEAFLVSKLKRYDFTCFMEAKMATKVNRKLKNGKLQKGSGEPTSSTYRNLCVRNVKAAFKWAEDEDLIDKNPLRAIRRPKAVNRKVIVSAVQWKTVEKYCLESDGRQPLWRIIRFMRLTGCRPQEARQLEARHYHRPSQSFVISETDPIAKGGIERQIILDDEARDIILPLLLKYPQGPLFRNFHDNPWSAAVLNNQFTRIQQRTGVRICAYAIRHTWATDALDRNVDSLLVARLMGHVDVQQLVKHYGHLEQKPALLMDALLKANGKPSKKRA